MATDGQQTTADNPDPPTGETDTTPTASDARRVPRWVATVLVPLATALIGVFTGVAVNVTSGSPSTTTKGGNGTTIQGPGNGDTGGTGSGGGGGDNANDRPGNGTGNAGNGNAGNANGTGNTGNGTGNTANGTGNTANGTGNTANGTGNANPGGAGNGTGNQGNVGTQNNGGRAHGGSATGGVAGGGDATGGSATGGTATGGTAGSAATANGGSAVNNNYFQLVPPSAAPVQENCAGLPTEVSAPAQTSVTFQTTVTVRCAPTAGRHYRLIVEIDDVGEHHTVNYYPHAEIPDAPGSYGYESVLSRSEIGSSRYLFVVSVDAAQATALDNAPDGELINGLPAGTQIVSDKVLSTRVR